MVKCEICGKEFKTGQGVAGHLRWVHNHPGKRQLRLFPTRRLITDDELLRLFKERDEENHRTRMDLLDHFHKGDLALLDQIEQLHGVIDELQTNQAQILKVLKRLTKVKK